MSAKQPIRLEGAVAVVPLTRGYEAVVDIADVHLVEPWGWYAMLTRGAVYAVRRQNVDGKLTTVLMHRVILNAPADMQVDHVDRNGLNNRRSNLRLATPVENGRNRGAQSNNTSGYKGVSWHKGDQQWRAVINVSGHQKFLGYFDTPEAAHAAYCEAAAKYFGKFARVA